MLGMSGGVDSSVAAYLLKEQGYEVYGVTMQIWPDKDECEVIRNGGCCSLSAVEDARRVANKLGISYYVLNFKEVFEKKVIDYFTNEYLLGRTPNPCIACNKYVKFEAMLDKAVSMGMDYVATGHYAKVEYDNDSGRYILKRSAFDRKDQSYALYNLTQHQLSKILFPLGDYSKEKIRLIAREIGLSVADKPDSQEICFVPDNDYAKFIEEKTGKILPEGDFIDENGKKIGRHKGIIHYTIGQRKGLGMTFGKPMFVTNIDPKHNIVTLGEKGKQYKNFVIAKNPNFISVDNLYEPTHLMCKTRYSAKPEKALVMQVDENTVTAEFESIKSAAAPGQAIVFYDGDIVVGGATIEKVR
ncbi:MAG: tRNA 2-thiouridine(34) synthase MnmA [Clostridia bacterium]|nr:tRNA 2-thiouridine(34) synthase MnmA [Clostridia bacterium]